MAAKAMQMRRANKLNRLFEAEFRTQKHVLDIYDRRVQVPDCPLFMVYQEGCRELDVRLKGQASDKRRPNMRVAWIAPHGVDRWRTLRIG